jgi:hypothetical protein
MTERARELAKTGSVKAAQRLLKQVQRMLQNLRAGMQPGGKAGKRQQQAQKLMETLRNLTQEQQKLLNRTYRRLRLGDQKKAKNSQEGQQAGPSEPAEKQLSESQKDAKPQEALRRKLGGLMVGFDELLGKLPRQLGQAEQAMRNATRSLKTDRQGPAMAAQSEVLEQLRQVRSGVSQQMARQQQGRGVRGQVGGARLKGVHRPEEEPFGRLEGDEAGLGMEDLGEIPDEEEVQRSHEILRELRRRAGDRQRSRNELDYIERLLRQF